MRKGTALSLYAAAAMFCVAGVLVAVVNEVWEGRTPLFPKLGSTVRVEESAAPQPVGVQLDERVAGEQAMTENRIRSDMSIFWITTYTRCKHEIAREEAPAKETIGWTYKQFAEYYPKYRLVIQGTNIRMERSIAQYCPDHYIIKAEDDDKIYVYRNVDGQEKLAMVYKLGFGINDVPEGYRDQLKKGMAFGSMEEIEGLIEDADS